MDLSAHRRRQEEAEAERKRQRQASVTPHDDNYIDTRLQESANAAQQAFIGLSQAAEKRIITDEEVVEVITHLDTSSFHLRCLLARR